LTDDVITVEVAYALPTKQLIKRLDISLGTTAIEAVTISNIAGEFKELIIDDDLKLGIFGKAVAHSHPLAKGDRVEIYRPLKIDPKEVRRQRAEAAKRQRESESN